MPRALHNFPFQKSIAILCALILPTTVTWAQAYPQPPYPGQQPYQQQQPYPQQQPYAQQQPYVQQAPAPQAGPTDAPLLPSDQLDNLVAPVALYPDQLLAQVLAASTYPLELVQAQQWMQQNRGLSGQQLIEAARQQGWDPSVQALVAFPDAMTMLTRDIRWTTDLGNAFLAQQADVMSAIQRMRARAQQNGRLQSTSQQTVTTEYDNGQSAIDIQPADPQVVYVPTYNPVYVWGPPAYGYYPPLWYPPVSYGFGFGAGCFLGGLFTGFLGFGGWGWGLSWFGHGLFLNGLFFNHFGFGGFHGGFGFGGGRTWWAHDPGHRGGIAYPNRSVAGRFGSPSRMDAARNGFRGFENRSAANRGFENRGAIGNRGFENRGFQNGSASANRGFENRGSVQNRGFENRGFNSGSMSRSFEAPRSGAQNFNRGAESREFSAPSQNFSRGSSAPSQNFSHGFQGGGFQGANRSFGPSQHFSAPQSHFSAPSQHFSAPQSHFSAPSSSGGGGGHFSAPHGSSFSGGHSGGGGGHSGGGSHSGGGGHHR